MLFRSKPPFPAVAGLFGQPTTINNVETLAAVPHILNNGAEWYKAMSLSNPKSTGTLVEALKEAPERGWTVVSMKDDWKTVFAPQ